MPLVSVIMPVFNREKYVGAAIESILAQTFADFELLIVDDASQDRSPEIIRSYAARDERIRFFQLERNLSQAGARNHALSLAQGAYIAMMDSDDLSLPERLEKQVDFLRANPGIGCVGVGARMVDEELTPGFTYRLPLAHPLILLSMFVGGSAMLYATILARREFLSEPCPYDPALLPTPDFDLFLRLVWEKRVKYANLPALLYLYRQHQSSISSQFEEWPPAQHTASRRRALKRLWGEAPDETLDRFIKVRPGIKLGWGERRLARRDISRLIESMVAAGWVEPGDQALMLEDMERRLEGTMPRFWQMFRHWGRNHFGR
ncbi:MAG: glycosyltransferase family 2 protein [Chloroflexi bacterium]|nr:glycosyltransferase family 2 protein [Chloroflexota bacterium]